ncbi:hypothetical protein BDP27DRAFT_1357249 [Rhodocollybia butyracea]|uniref:Uncharacterized protein n=1 Tax=Rhodocollybia butyracea TaxID=206335 RepID=A0A9P5UG17_9AGAR|nr:hypothetical protein BDP27DRAFT_1357249 [Rhodocollybia butyracea]
MVLLITLFVFVPVIYLLRYLWVGQYTESALMGYNVDQKNQWGDRVNGDGIRDRKSPEQLVEWTDGNIHYTSKPPTSSNHRPSGWTESDSVQIYSAGRDSHHLRRHTADYGGFSLEPIYERVRAKKNKTVEYLYHFSLILPRKPTLLPYSSNELLSVLNSPSRMSGQVVGGYPMAWAHGILGKVEECCSTERGPRKYYLKDSVVSVGRWTLDAPQIRMI